MALVLKRGRVALDTPCGMTMREIKQRVQSADYAIDSTLVAEAMLRHAVSHRRCWNPRAVWAMPAASSSTPDGPARTLPIQVNGAADAAA
jgi:hypothetical protein